MSGPDRVEMLSKVSNTKSPLTPLPFTQICNNASTVHSLTITPYEYTSTQCLMAIDTEKDIDSGITRLKICAGELLTPTYKYAKPAARGPVNVQLVADLMHIVLRSDHILEIPDTGVGVFD